ncbi:DUF302 domain-containing protein [candidate division WOR-3 bacterium]|uniref:DUF302 domain-containing protein n=1 Tax=candidate division WOR-3 bacterium TaxID=2052148 RepID=A0A9D5K8Q5_UNCW3|nr:DUF302 domain-containing protein [candidate division WOR-3 bacterium]MBD3364426.1 DUF302 domain-containing protein [candidate division WOR-3 bacterium]
MLSYGFKKALNLPFEKTIKKVTAELKKEGFGVLTEIDVKEVLKKKLDVDFPRYRILGACNPPNAYKSLQAEEDIGLMLPCNVIIYEKGENTVVSVIKPTAAMGMISNPELREIAETVEEKLKRVFESL